MELLWLTQIRCVIYFFFLFGDLKSILIFWDGLQAIQLNGKDTLLSILSFDLSL